MASRTPSPRRQYSQSSPSRSFTVFNPVSIKRKRSLDSDIGTNDLDVVRPPKHLRKLSSAVHQLSEENLRILTGEEMDSTRPKYVKRSSSRRSITTSSDTTLETTRSQRSSNNNAFYRYTHLKAANVFIHSDLPNDIQMATDLIIKAKPSETRRTELRGIAQEFHKTNKEKIKAALGEDDFVDPFRTVLKAIKSDDLMLTEKASWREELKPTILEADLDFSFLGESNTISNPHQEREDAVAPPPPKRQQQSPSETPVSPDSCMSNRSNNRVVMPPPAFIPHRAKETSLIKTPCPDFSIGTNQTALTSALSRALLNFNDIETERFLDRLKGGNMPNDPDEPALIFVPTQRPSTLVFPFAVVEGKAYSTGKQIFEAQNQAAVSGVSALKIQLCLDALVERATQNSPDVPPTSLKEGHALFFSVCTEGPYHELWVHYTYIKHGERIFNMALLKYCNGLVLEGLEDFIVAIDNVLRWGTGPFLDSVVERLEKVARRAGAGTIYQ